MADGIYIGMAGATARAAQLEAISDNLANAQTPGFKKQAPAFQAVFAESLRNDSLYPAAVSTAVDMSPGAVMRTDERLDVTPNEGNFLAVRTGGSVAFTRNGHLTVSNQGELMSAGSPVLDRSGQTIRLPDGKAGTPTEVHPDGTVYCGTERIGQLATFALTGPMERLGTSLIRPQETGRATMVEGTVQVGELEMGNSSPLQAAVEMVAAQRHFEASMQTIQTYRTMDERTNELGKVK